MHPSKNTFFNCWSAYKNYVRNVIFSKAFNPQKLESFKTFYSRAFKGKAFMEIEQNDDAYKYWLETCYRPIYHDNTIIGVACHSRDKTQVETLDGTISLESKPGEGAAFTVELPF